MDAPHILTISLGPIAGPVYRSTGALGSDAIELETYTEERGWWPVERYDNVPEQYRVALLAAHEAARDAVLATA